MDITIVTHDGQIKSIMPIGTELEKLSGSKQIVLESASCGVTVKGKVHLKIDDKGIHFDGMPGSTFGFGVPYEELTDLFLGWWADQRAKRQAETPV